MKSISVLMILAALSLGFEAPQFVTGTVYDDSGQTLPGVTVVEKGTTSGVTTDINGFYSIQVSSEKSKLVFSLVGYATQEIHVGKRKVIDVTLSTDTQELQEIVVTGNSRKRHKRSFLKSDKSMRFMSSPQPLMGSGYVEYDNDFNTEEYSTINENEFRKVIDKPLSTFSIEIVTIDSSTNSSKATSVPGGTQRYIPVSGAVQA